MNDLTVQDPGARDIVGRAAPKQFNFMPTSVPEMMELAKLIAASNFCPKGFNGRAGDVLVVMMMSAELGIPYFQGLQNICVINGRPTVWGDLVTALVHSSGELEYILESWDEDSETATATVKRKGFPERVETFSMADARRARLAGKDTYVQYPQRMCKWRALTFALRAEFPDVLKGMLIAEEAMDYPPVVQVNPIAPVRALTAAMTDEFLAPPSKEKKPKGKAAPAEPAGELVRVRLSEMIKEGVTPGKKPGDAPKPWTLYKVTLEDGREMSAFSSTVHETAFHAAEVGVAVRIKTRPGRGPGQFQIMEITPVLDEDGGDEEEPDTE